MVKRRKYTAIVLIKSGELVNGEWVESEKESIKVKGHYDTLMDSTRITRANPMGEEESVKGFFFTSKKPNLQGTPSRLIIEELAINVRIICWDSWQSHSIICV